MTFNTTGGAKDFIIGNNGFNLHNHNIIFNVAEGTDPSGVDLEVSARLWNNMGIQKTGAGTMLIKGDTANPNDYRGGTTINAGTLILGENGSLGSGNVTVAEGSTLEIQTQQGSTQTWNGGTISGAGTLNVSGSGAFTITPAQMQIADNGKVSRKQPRQVELQEIGLIQRRRQLGKVFQQVADRLAVDFHDFQPDSGILEQILREHAGPRTDLQHRPAAAECSHDGLCHTLVGEEMLPEGFLGPDRLHHLAMKYLYIRAIPWWRTLSCPSPSWAPLQMITKPYFSSGLKNMALLRP